MEPIHWTYADLDDPDDDLRQGDILRPDDARLRDVFRAVHPHFLSEKYRGFMIATQTCDLVRRDGGICSAQHVNLVVIRALTDVLPSLLSSVSDEAAEGVYFEDRKRDAKLLLERVFNQNEAAFGLFYLHPDVAAGIVEPCVAVLRVGVAFRVSHYEVLRGARVGRLAAQFQDKLGWMLGNLFSRVATEDWHDRSERKREMKKLVERAIHGDDLANSPLWVKRHWVSAAKRAAIDIKALARSDIEAVLEQHRPATPPEQVIEQVTKAVKDALPWVCTEDMRRVVARLQNDPVFHASFRDPATD